MSNADPEPALARVGGLRVATPKPVLPKVVLWPSSLCRDGRQRLSVRPTVTAEPGLAGGTGSVIEVGTDRIAG
jgi:hypothetical protein